MYSAFCRILNLIFILIGVLLKTSYSKESRNEIILFSIQGSIIKSMTEDCSYSPKLTRVRGRPPGTKANSVCLPTFF
ncbi:MAG: hypothetical protein ACTSQJ_01810 [Promethearchaeota archaeon]